MPGGGGGQVPEVQEEIPGEPVGRSLDYPKLGKLIKYLKSQQRNPTKPIQRTPKAVSTHILSASSQESTNRRMAPQGQLPSAGEQDSTETLQAQS